MTTSATPPADPRPCNRCKEHEGTVDLRGAERVCKSCFAYYVSTKAVKRLEVLQRETAAPRGSTGSSNSSNGPKGQRKPQRYLVGLSCGPSSTALLHVLTENVRQQRARGQKTARFEYVAAHVVDDTLLPPLAPSSSPSSSIPTTTEDPTITAYRTRFPSASILVVPLSSALTLPTVDWSSLPSPLPSSSSSSPDPEQQQLPPSHRLSRILQHLPSATSRADVRRLLTRHVLLALARDRTCDALLLGHSTTSLAELTLSETAKGRGHSVPWLVNDGVVSVPRVLVGFVGSSGSGDDNNNATTTEQANPSLSAATPSPHAQAQVQVPVYSPLRELFRKELLTYLSQTDPPLTDILTSTPSSSTDARNGGGAVISHRDQSIDDVLSRYFADVETHYPSVVANVVRTTGKLRHPPPPAGGDDDHGGGGGGDHCGLCGTGLDELGDERWRGEIGDRVEAVEGDGNKKGGKPKLCYGCERSVRG
ncbi:Mitochondrial oxaloacetate carrier protein [Hypoxylon texense]